LGIKVQITPCFNNFFFSVIRSVHIKIAQRVGKIFESGQISCPDPKDGQYRKGCRPHPGSHNIYILLRIKEAFSSSPVSQDLSICTNFDIIYRIIFGLMKKSVLFCTWKLKILPETNSQPKLKELSANGTETEGTIR
jgi:hypothetical protein